MKHKSAFMAPSTQLTIKWTDQSNDPFNALSPDAETAALLQSHDMSEDPRDSRKREEMLEKLNFKKEMPELYSSP